VKKSGKAQMLRLHFGENDKWQGKPLYQAIIEKCREMNMAGATVYRGIEGYGASTLIHRRHLLSFSQDLPLTVTVVDTAENIQKLVGVLDEMVAEGLIAISDVDVIEYSQPPGATATPRGHS
jgi:PII-like signaling protein